MRILVIGQFYPWPADSGARLRLANVVNALLPLGEVDLFVATRDTGHPTTLPEDAPIHHGMVSHVRVLPWSATRRVSWLVRSDVPLEVAIRDFSTVRTGFQRFVADRRYDLTWVSRMETFAAVEPCLTGPAIVDIDDVRDAVTTARFAAYESDGLRGGVAGPLRRFQTRRNASSWARFRRHISDSVGTVVVCSETDRIQVGAANARVIPNGYDAPADPSGRTAIGDPPTILLQGTLSYPPNVDGARYLVERVAPIIRRQLPSIELRIVGRPSPAVSELGDSPGVTVTGRVPKIEEELARADIVAVPIRFGGGTRIKILEGFAHRIPVVSTSLGAYGLGVTDRRHIRLADTPQDFADACVSLLTDERERKSMVDEAETLFLDSFQWSNIADSIRNLVLEVSSVPTV